MSADNNKIIDNNILGSRYGVWVASRQSMPLRNSRCGDGYYAEEKFSEDYAKYNLVKNNNISDGDFGVLIEDDYNIVESNSFHNIREHSIRVGTPIRFKYLNRPVVGVEVLNNRLDDKSIKGVFLWGSSGD